MSIFYPIDKKKVSSLILRSSSHGTPWYWFNVDEGNPPFSGSLSRRSWFTDTHYYLRYIYTDKNGKRIDSDLVTPYYDVGDATLQKVISFIELSREPLCRQIPLPIWGRT